MKTYIKNLSYKDKVALVHRGLKIYYSKFGFTKDLVLLFRKWVEKVALGTRIFTTGSSPLNDYVYVTFLKGKDWDTYTMAQFTLTQLGQ